jgi:hypothetical protein
MGRLPEDGEEYAIMNGQHGKFIHVDTDDGSGQMDVRSPDLDSSGEQKWQVSVISGHEFKISISSSGGPASFKLHHSKPGSEVKFTLDFSSHHTSEQEWVVADNSEDSDVYQ